MKLIDIHWGWITPGVGQANRRRQLDDYMDILEARPRSGDRFFFTQPGWLLDIDQAETVRMITTSSPEKGKADGPMRPAQLARFRAAVARGQLVYVAYPYSGAVVEGMDGEAVLKALRLTRDIAARQLDTEVTGFFVHDGPFQLDWNAPMIPQIGRLAGFTEIFGKTLALIVSPDGTLLPMLGQPLDGVDLLYAGTEAPHLPVHQHELEARFGRLACATAEDVAALSGRADLPRVSSEVIRTKGWYGGAPLVMQQQAALRRTDLVLGVLSFNYAVRGDASALNDYWKRSLVLQDCHLQWLLADVGAHYLPLARALEAEVRERLLDSRHPEVDTQHPGEASTTLSAGSDASNAGGAAPSFAFNPLPHRRSGVLPRGERYAACADVGPASAVAVRPDDDARVHAQPDVLENNRIRVELGGAGEILGVFDRAGAVLYRGTANRVRHWVNRPADGTFLLRQMGIWEVPFSGCLRLETEIDVPAAGTYPIFFDVVRGLIVAMACEDDDWVPATNLHWGGGLPSGSQEHGYSQTGELTLRRGRNRIVVHAMADEGFKLRDAVLRLNGTPTALRYWTGHKVLEWADDPFTVERVDVREMGARAAVVFQGRFDSCSATLTVALEHDSERIDVRLTRHYDRRVYEGLQTLPLPLEIGSYLGSTCERPYVPAFTVEHETARHLTHYTSDKPYGFSPACDSDRAWMTGRFRDFFGGMAPFLGIGTGIAETPGRSLAMLTDGHGHFFRRRPRHENVETLGLSLGSSVVHPMTQNYRVPPGSYWEKIARGKATVDYDDAHETFDFMCPAGDITCEWSLVFRNSPAISRRACRQHLLERLCPLQVADRAFDSGFELSGDEVVCAGLEREGDAVLLRLVNLSDREQTFAFKLPGAARTVPGASGLVAPELTRTAAGWSGRLPPKAVREWALAPSEPEPKHR